jgi:ADP-ribosylglycohydrolase
MISAIAGDIIGSRFEFHNMFDENFELFSSKCNFTDDTVLTVATADVLLNGGTYADKYLKYAQEHRNRGYGGSFLRMVSSGKLIPYNSYGNGSAMRISPVGWAFNSFDDTMKEAKRSAECTHDHPEGVKGAQATAAMIYMGRLKESKPKMKKFISDSFGYDLSTQLEKLPSHFDVTCQGTVPKSIIIFLETENFEDAMRKSIVSGGDVDTIACIVGGMCDAYYGLPSKEVCDNVYERLPSKMANVVLDFVEKYIEKK